MFDRMKQLTTQDYSVEEAKHIIREELKQRSWDKNEENS